MKYGVVISARLGSTRLPSKSVKPLAGVPMLAYLIRRLHACVEADAMLLATTQRPEDDRLEELARIEGIDVFRGAEEDVVKRYVDAAATFGIDRLVRVTGDCPFVNAEIVDHCIRLCRQNEEYDIASTKGLFPIGLDVEVFGAAELTRQHNEEPLNASHREHLTKYFYDNCERYAVFGLHPLPAWRCDEVFTVDTPEDMVRARRIAESFGTVNFGAAQLAAMCIQQASDGASGGRK